jgi:hypothetical protein
MANDVDSLAIEEREREWREWRGEGSSLSKMRSE